MKALVLLANGFEEVEGITQIDFLRRGGVEVVSASIHDSKKITGAHDIHIGADETLSNVNPDEFDIVVLPGGYGGMMNFKNSEAVAGLLKKFVSENKWIAAICASPSVFGVLGLAEGKKCTCYPGFEEEMKGADCTGENVVVDGKMITSKGPGTSIDFALKMIEILVSKEKADEVAEAAQYSK